jgi:hypothetical protein
MNTVLIIVAVAAYAFIGGTVGYGFYLRRTANCADCHTIRPILGTSYCHASHDKSAGFLGFAWPLTIPILAGMFVARQFGTREARAEQREQRKQADHERRMAELAAENAVTMDAVKFLVENGIKADVPGLYDTTGAGA